MREKMKLAPIRETEHVYRMLRARFPNAWYVSLDQVIPYFKGHPAITKVEYKAYTCFDESGLMHVGSGDTPIDAYNALLRRLEDQQKEVENANTSAT